MICRTESLNHTEKQTVLTPVSCRKELQSWPPGSQCGVWDLGVQLTHGVSGNFSHAYPVFAGAPAPRVGDIWCVLGAKAGLSTPPSQTTNNNISCHSNLQKGQEGGPRELQAGQPHLHPGKGDGAAYPGGHHEASGRKEGYQE